MTMIRLITHVLREQFAPGRAHLFKISAHRKSEGASVYRRGSPKGGRILFTRDRSVGSKTIRFETLKTAYT